VSDAVFPSWPGETVAILGGGPSLTREQVDYCRGKCRVIAVNRAYAWAPWADILYGHDTRFWRQHAEAQRIGDIDFPPALEFPGLKLTRQTETDPSVLRIPRGEKVEDVLEGRVFHRFDSGHDAVQIAAICTGPSGVILLLGFDGRPNGHWHAGYTKKQTLEFEKVRASHDVLWPVLREYGVTLVNCTPGSSIDAYPMVPLEDAL
jgi:hypothetical protein